MCQQLLSEQPAHWLKFAVRDGHADLVGKLMEGHLELLQAMCDEFVSAPYVSLEVACELIKLGLRPTYEQIVVKARQGVRGVYIWACAFQQLQLPSGLPPQAEALCCNQPLVRDFGLPPKPSVIFFLCVILKQPLLLS
jgi:hypothetical protein